MVLFYKENIYFITSRERWSLNGLFLTSRCAIINEIKLAKNMEEETIMADL